MGHSVVGPDEDPGLGHGSAGRQTPDELLVPHTVAPLAGASLARRWHLLLTFSPPCPAPKEQCTAQIV